MPFSQIFPPSPSPIESIRLFYPVFFWSKSSASASPESLSEMQLLNEDLHFNQIPGEPPAQ